MRIRRKDLPGGTSSMMEMGHAVCLVLRMCLESLA